VRLSSQQMRNNDTFIISQIRFDYEPLDMVFLFQLLTYGLHEQINDENSIVI